MPAQMKFFMKDLLVRNVLSWQDLFVMKEAKKQKRAIWLSFAKIASGRQLPSNRALQHILIGLNFME